MSPPFTRPATPTHFGQGTSPPKARLSERPASTSAGLRKTETPKKTSSDAGGSSQPPPRPPNAWILYRSHKIAQLRAEEQLRAEQSGQASNSAADPDGMSGSPTKPLFTAALAALAAAKNDSTVAFTTMRSSSPTPSLSTDAVSTAITMPSTAVSRSLPAGFDDGKLTDKSVSSILAELWKTENQATKRSFFTLAEQKKEEHRAAWPNYKYSPRTTEKSRQARERRRLLGMRDKRSRDPEESADDVPINNSDMLDAKPTAQAETSDPNVTPTKRQALERANSPRRRGRTARTGRHDSRGSSASPLRRSKRSHQASARHHGSIDLSSPSASRVAAAAGQVQSLGPTSSASTASERGTQLPRRRSPRLSAPNSAGNERPSAFVPIFQDNVGALTSSGYASLSSPTDTTLAPALGGSVSATASISHTGAPASKTRIHPIGHVAAANELQQSTSRSQAPHLGTAPMAERGPAGEPEHGAISHASASAFSSSAKGEHALFLTDADQPAPDTLTEHTTTSLGPPPTHQQAAALASIDTSDIFFELGISEPDLRSERPHTSSSSMAWPFDNIPSSFEATRPLREPPVTAVDIFGETHGTLHQPVADDFLDLGWDEATNQGNTESGSMSAPSSGKGGILYDPYDPMHLPTALHRTAPGRQDAQQDQELWALANELLEGINDPRPTALSAFNMANASHAGGGMDLSFDDLDFTLPAANSSGSTATGINATSTSTGLDPDTPSWLLAGARDESSTCSQTDPRLELSSRVAT